MTRTAVGSAVTALLLGGCLSPVDITTAYDSEVYLCDDDAAYAARVAECRALRDAGEDCSGVFSFEGVIDGVDVVVDANLTRVDTVSLRLPDLSLMRDNVDLYGDSPYFSFRMSIASLGDADTRPDGDVTQEFGRSPVCEDGSLDGEVRFSIRITAAGGSADDDLTTGSITMTRQTTDEHIGAFEGAYRDGSPLRGCFTVFTDMAQIEQATVCP